jgi:UrcA family protein
MSTSVLTLTIRAVLVIAALSSPLWSDTAAAGPATASTVIQYRDLDLSTDAGVQAVYERIKTAARHVCFLETSEHPGIDQQARYFACYEDALANAVKQIGESRLAALHRTQSRLAGN